MQIYVFFAFLEQNKNNFYCEIKKKNERLSICQVDFSNMIVFKKHKTRFDAYTTKVQAKNMVILSPNRNTLAQVEIRNPKNHQFSQSLSRFGASTGESGSAPVSSMS